MSNDLTDDPNGGGSPSPLLYILLVVVVVMIIVVVVLCVLLRRKKTATTSESGTQLAGVSGEFESARGPKSSNGNEYDQIPNLGTDGSDSTSVTSAATSEYGLLSISSPQANDEYGHGDITL